MNSPLHMREATPPATATATATATVTATAAAATGIMAALIHCRLSAAAGKHLSCHSALRFASSATEI